MIKSLLISSSDNKRVFITVLELLYIFRPRKYFDIIFVQKSKHKILASTKEVRTHVPVFTTISPKYMVVLVFAKHDCVISVFDFCVEGLH